MHSRKIAADELLELGTQLFDAAGSPHDQSKVVSEILVRSSLMGHDSHGIVRFPQYSKWIHDKQIVPGAAIEVVKDGPSFCVIDGHFGWGQVVAKRAMEIAMEKARDVGVATVVVRNCMHIGRLGEYSATPATAGMMGSVLVSGYGGKDLVAPWGGAQPRLSANPLSWAAPTGYAWPFLVDITTSVVPEGKVHVALNAGTKVPEGCLIDRTGNPTTNPIDLYNGGAILTFGGIVGHKGYGLNLVAELFAGALSGMGCRGQGNGSGGGVNSIFLQAIDIGQLFPLKQFIESVQVLIAHLKSCPPRPGVEEVLIPGEVEYRTQERLLNEGISVSEGTWEQIEEAASELGVTV